MSLKRRESMKQYKRFKYDDEAMKKAIRDVKNGASLNAAAAAHNVPKSTLHSRVSGRIPEGAKMGPKSVLTEEEEDHLKQWILGKAKVGFPMHPDEVKDAVQRILQASPRENPFKDNRPGEKWMSLFIKRHPDITANAELISRGKIPAKNSNWFTKIRNFLEEINSLDVLSRPSSIFYLEESVLLVCGRTGKILGIKGEEKASEIAANVTEKEYVTLLSSFSANGKIPPPMIIYPYKRIPTQISRNFPEEWGLGRSDDGIMGHTIFLDYLMKIFSWCEKNVEFPVIFFVDSKKFRVSSEIYEFCGKKGIILYSLPRGSPMMRTFDAAVLRPMRNSWKKAIVEGEQSGEKRITKMNFAGICKKSFDDLFVGDDGEVIRKGFKDCGLYPFGENANMNCGKSEAPLDDGGNEHFSVQDFAVTKRVIEYFVGPEKAENFKDLMKSWTEGCGDSLFLCWKMCADQVDRGSLETERDEME